MRGLEGVRVLELGELVSAAYAAKLLADLGADVVKVESPAGDRARRRGPFPGGTPDPERSGLFLYLNTNKRSVVLSLEDPAERARLDALIARSDILVHNLPAARLAALDLGYPTLARVQPSLVVCSITPFGLTGPRAGWRAEELQVTNAGGWAWLSPGALERPELPPLKAAGHQADFQGGLAGATAALASYYRAQRTGEGEHIDLSVQAYVASILEAGIITHTYLGPVPTRHGQRGLNPWGIYRAKDGLIFLSVIEEDQWGRLVELMGRPEWAQLEPFQNALGRLQNVDVLTGFVQEWIADWKVDDLYHEGQKRRVCFAPVLEMRELAAQDHLEARGFFVDVEHPEAGRVTQLGAPYRLANPWWKIRRPAPRLGEHGGELLRAPLPSEPHPAVPARGLPLEGVRVIDLSWVWAGPFGAMQLAHLGAEVIKIESEGRPDLGRRLPIFVPDLPPGLNRSGYFNQWNQGKRSVRLNLAEPRAIELLRRLIAKSDVVIDNFATGVMERLGLGYPVLRELKPDLIAASISGYGHTGPRRAYMAYGPAIAPLSGLATLSGYPGGAPREVGISLGDPTAGISAAAAICAALAARARTGEGQHIDVSLWESTAALMAEGWMDFALNGTQPARMGNRDPWMAPHGAFRCAGEDAWIAIACADDAEWRALARAIDPDLLEDPRFVDLAARRRNEDALEACIAGWTRTQDAHALAIRLQAVGVPAYPSLSAPELVQDPQLAARGFFERLEHAEVGRRTHAGIPWLLTHGRNGVRSPAPLLGADTESVLRDLLGHSPEEIARLTEDKILY